MKKAENVKTEEKQTEQEVVDELFFISEVKMKEADIESVELELESEEDSEEAKTQEGGTEA